ncbi:MAG: cell division protein FtsL [Burkholderiaceae bacterium]|nr:cell division protein FtsL [Burkholderiaceae bacterium]MCD8515848.1 cell division protein FtsL [Burkholderiaceae bacterium]MCD8536956.1 cell division protein FtsL [Burkholderiaceae bacterium]MCD8565737.1 cell division protein FtsL [Burkholderiaceae bacterium]
MGRAVIVMALLLMLAALSLVTARYQSRHLFIQNEQLRAQASELDVAWRQLQLDRAELSRNARVDRIAREQLQMIPISPSRTLYIRDENPSSTVGGN